ncbi:hypothetical protein, partial [Asaia prunellae]|uniref:hypothetical protein n=1 Tax=Asaia prunellae TaxID=610245 RepID=UPI001A7E2C39
AFAGAAGAGAAKAGATRVVPERRAAQKRAGRISRMEKQPRKSRGTLANMAQALSRDKAAFGLMRCFDDTRHEENVHSRLFIGDEAGALG